MTEPDTLAELFLEIWLQALDAWLVFLYRLPQGERREQFRQATVRSMTRFVDAMRSLDFGLLEEIQINSFEETKSIN